MGEIINQLSSPGRSGCSGTGHSSLAWAAGSLAGSVEVGMGWERLLVQPGALGPCVCVCVCVCV